MSKYFKGWKEADTVLNKLVDDNFKLKFIIVFDPYIKAYELDLQFFNESELSVIPSDYAINLESRLSGYFLQFRRSSNIDSLVTKYSKEIVKDYATDMLLDNAQKELDNAITQYELKIGTSMKEDLKVWLDVKQIDNKKEVVDEKRTNIKEKVSKIKIGDRVIGVGDILICECANYRVDAIYKNDFDYIVKASCYNGTKNWRGAYLASVLDKFTVISEVE